ARTQLAPLLDALQPDDRAIYATALYAGLRLGELQALQWDDIDLTTNLIHIKRGWDRQQGFISPKSRAGTRRVRSPPPSAANSKPTAPTKPRAATAPSPPTQPIPARSTLPPSNST